ncbi:protein STRUBBELIG-RECEPTOR FAMILY 3-like isoform X1 [Iris pallida]|uniref:Protein STRUBBELIG-RECEPTOR FAMILY 3-like isoform X1 n=1 Tax=Iris pallida TaxID=29817 RepID=A0AAX6I7L9_IRIPA|nr:protein STRUBBELIG-RECEPTOR FAMILY 3-like isoform X1 [Iris pallida]
MDMLRVRMSSLLVVSLMVISSLPCSQGYTDEQDVFAINTLYVSLGAPLLPGWRIGGDPCLEAWQGVQCVNSNITAIILNAANLGGQLTNALGNFTSMITIDLSGNHIGGSIPENLPPTLRKFFLAGNQLNGSIPGSLSNLTLLTDMSLTNNILQGELPDAFQTLTGLVNLDLSFNNLSGKLPPSMASLLSLNTLHVQNNHLSGTLNVLQDVPLGDLNVENNLFSGPIPEKLLTIPNFKKDGNPFNISTPPSPAPASSLLPPPGAPSSEASSSQNPEPPAKNRNSSTIRFIIYSAIAVASLFVALLLILVCVTKCPKTQKVELGRPKVPVDNEKLISQNNDSGRDVAKSNAEKEKEDEINKTMRGLHAMPSLDANVTENSGVPSDKIQTVTPEKQSPVSSFSIATLQQYTDSFGEENLISNVKLGKVYLAELSDGKLLTVLNIDNAGSAMPTDEFLELVSILSGLRHPNVLELVGYCAEFGQRLLVYNHFSRRTLHDILHGGDNIKKKLSWNARVHIALGASRALEYLHEGCQSPVIHENFESASILVDDGLEIRVSECGLAPLMVSDSAAQVRAVSSYGAPEVGDSGSCTDKSDVYSFGVVMLELLTGRKPYDRSRPREEWHLVRWASSQLYDINALSRMVDTSIDGKFPMKSLSWFADIINRCIQQEPEFRPPMSQVVQDLSRMIEDARTNASTISSASSEGEAKASGQL